MAQPKTNAMRLLDKAGITYQVVSYDYDEDDLSGVSAAKHMGLSPSMVFKTLVLLGTTAPVLVCLLPVDRTLNLKSLAALSGEKRVTPAHVKDLLALTGYMRGGCSPIGMKKPYPVYADNSLLQQDQVLVNAGKRGLQLQLAPRDLVAYCRITLGDLLQ